MGVQLEVRHDSGVAPDWAAIRNRLVALGETVVLRMIDGLPAFPDETPEPGWAELRVGLTGGMVTLRRGPNTLTCIVWGNADPALFLSRDRLAWACADATGGAVVLDDGTWQPAAVYSVTRFGR